MCQYPQRFNCNREIKLLKLKANYNHLKTLFLTAQIVIAR